MLGTSHDSFTAQEYSSNIIESWKRQKSIFKLILASNKFNLMLAVLISLVYALLSAFNFLIIQQIIGCFNPNKECKYPVKYLALVYIVINFLNQIMNRHLIMIQNVIANKASIELISLVYNKIQTVSPSGKKGKAKEGEIINFIQIDADKVILVFTNAPTFLIGIFQLFLYTYLLFNFFHYFYFAGLFVFFIVVLINQYLFRKSNEYNKEYLMRKDDRMRLTTQIFSHLKILKFNSWESTFKDSLFKKREAEVESYTKISGIYISTIFIYWTAPPIISLSTIGAYFYFTGSLDAETIFTGMSILMGLQDPLRYTPFAISSFIDLLLSLKRIEKFMDENDRLEYNIQKASGNEDVSLKIDKGNFAWELIGNKENDIIYDMPVKVLSNINFEIKKGEFVAVIGEVGSGKSSLLRALLNDMYLCDDQRNVGDVIFKNGSIAYVSQTAWIQNATVQDNILLFKPMNKSLYDKVLKICELEDDLKILDGGDLTEIGEKGINLSGGQKMRVSLARSAYSQADCYLLDDPLAALDGNVGQSIFNKFFKEELKDKTRLFVTNNFQYLPEVDRIILLKQGHIIFDGNYKSLSELSFFDSFSMSMNKLKEEERNKASDLDPQVQISFTGIPPITNDENQGSKIISEEAKGEGSVGAQIYLKYFEYCGGKYMILIVLLGIFLWEAFRRVGDFWMRAWMTNPWFEVAIQNYYVYAGIVFFGNFFIYLRLKTLVLGNLNLCLSLHTKMVNCLMDAPINLYHDTEPNGRILNRLSKDLENLNEAKHFIGSIFLTTFSVSGTIFIIAFYNPYVLFWVPIMLVLGIVSMRKYIHPSRELKRIEGMVRSKILNVVSEIIPGISIISADHQTESYRKHLNKLLTDLTKLKIFIAGFDCWNGLMADFNGVSFIAVVLAFVGLFPEMFDQVSAGQSIMYTTTIRDDLFWTLYAIGYVEKIMVSMERCLQYTDIPSEKQICKLPAEAEYYNDDSNKSCHNINSDSSQSVNASIIDGSKMNVETFEIKVVPDEWPSKGKIEFINYSVGYRPGCQIVLKSLNLNIQGGEKIGVVGRTGSGKSTMSLCLFRLLEAWGGSIQIDGLDISQIPLYKLRESLTIIPQDSAILEGTLRHNIDPLMKYKDEDIISVLQSIGLWELLKEKNINALVTDDNLSVGERQLVCIARAIMRKSKIVVIDEATASIDVATEEKIQLAFKKFLNDSTVIAIAHRIKTISSYDKVLVLDKGKLAEFDSPEILLKNPKGIFFGLHEKSTNNIE